MTKKMDEKFLSRGKCELSGTWVFGSLLILEDCVFNTSCLTVSAKNAV